MNRDHCACDACGRVEHIDLLDAKPDDPSNPQGCDWQRLECIACYGPDHGGWCPANGWFPGCSPDPFRLSICEELHGLYRGWRILHWFYETRAAFRLWRFKRTMRRLHKPR